MRTYLNGGIRFMGLIPGPSVCFTVAHSIKFGTIRTLPFIFGIVLITYTLLGGKTRYWLVKKGYGRNQNRLTGVFLIGAGTALEIVHKK